MPKPALIRFGHILTENGPRRLRWLALGFVLAGWLILPAAMAAALCAYGSEIGLGLAIALLVILLAVAVRNLVIARRNGVLDVESVVLLLGIILAAGMLLLRTA